jgi:predicted metal-dependent hydrolase
MNEKYEIIYSKRKTIALTISRDGLLVIKAPLRVNLNLVKNFVDSKRNWIQRHILKAKAAEPKSFLEGELFWYLGKQYPLRIVTDRKQGLEFTDAFYLSDYRVPKAREYFLLWYREQAKKILQQRCAIFAQQMGVTFKNITIRDTDTRWGSCSSLGNLNFCYRLVMAPLPVIDYVVVHELSHLVHKNHSVRFWSLVAQYYPEYLSARKWLRVNGYILVL